MVSAPATLKAAPASGTAVVIAELVRELALEHGRPTPNPSRQNNLMRALEAAVTRQAVSL